MMATFDIEIVAFETDPVTRLEGLATVVNGLTGLGERDTANPCWTCDPVVFPLDIHYPCSFHLLSADRH